MVAMPSPCTRAGHCGPGHAPFDGFHVALEGFKVRVKVGLLRAAQLLPRVLQHGTAPTVGVAAPGFAFKSRGHTHLLGPGEGGQQAVLHLAHGGGDGEG